MPAMKVAVIFQSKKFIVVVPPESTINGLKTEIERVYNALFPTPSPPQSVAEVQTATGCVVYDGYTASSVLSDNDIVIAVTEHTSDDTSTPSVSKVASGSAYMLPYYGVSPMGYQTPMLSPHMVNPSFVSPQKHYTPIPYNLPSHSGTSTPVSVQPPVVRTVGSQCPSPTENSNDTFHRHPPQVDRGIGETADHQVEVVEESEAPLLSRNQRPSQTAVGDMPSHSDSESRRQRDGRKSDLTHKGTATKRRLTLGTQSGPSGIKRKGDRSNMDDRGSGSDTHTKLSTGKNKPTANSTSNSNSTTVQVDCQSDSHLSQTDTTTTVQEGQPRPDHVVRHRSSQRKRRLSTRNERGSKRMKCAVALRNVTEKRSPETGKAVHLPNEGSSDWTSSDESAPDVSTRMTTNKSIPVSTTTKQVPVAQAAVDDDSTSEWESASEDESKPQHQPLASVQTTKKVAQNIRGKRESLQPSTSKEEPLKGRKKSQVVDISSSSSEWCSDEETKEEKDASSQKVPSSPPKEKYSSPRLSQSDSNSKNTTVEEKRVEDLTSSKSDKDVAESIETNKACDEEENVEGLKETESHSDRNGSQISDTLNSWSQNSAGSSPRVRVYTAHDGHKIKRKWKPNISKHARKVAVQKERGSAESAANEHPHNDVDNDGGTTNGEILAPNSIASDDETTKILSQTHDDVTVIQETQEARDSIHSPSPEIPFLGNSHSLSSPSDPPQKVVDDVTLHRESGTSIHVSGVQLQSADGAHDVEEKESDCQSISKHTNSTGETEQSEHSAGEHKSLKSNKKATIDEGHSVEGSLDTAVSVSQSSCHTAERSRKAKKIPNPQSENSNNGRKSMSCNDSDVALEESSKEKRTSSRKTLCDTTVVPSSQTDASDENMEVSNSENTEEEDASLGTVSRLAVSQENSEEWSALSQSEMESSASTLSNSQRKKKSKHRKSKKRKSKPLTTSDEVKIKASAVEVSSPTASSADSVAVQSAEAAQLEGQETSKEDGPATDRDTTDVNSDSSQTVTQSSLAKRTKHKKKKKQSRENPSQQESHSITKEMNGSPSPSDADEQTTQTQSQNKNVSGSPAPSPPREDEQSSDEESHVIVHTPTSTKTALPHVPNERTEDGFLKPQTKSSKKSSRSKTLQLSPAARTSTPISLSQGSVEQCQQKSSEMKKKLKGNSLLSVFSVTETEVSSDDESSAVKTRAKDSKKPRTFNFLSSLSSHGKKMKPVRQSLPFPRSTHSTHTSRFSSDSAMRMFSLTHTSRSSTSAAAGRKTKLHSTPTLPKASPAEQKNVGPLLDDILKETGVEGGEGEGGKQPSLAEVLADGFLWDT